MVEQEQEVQVEQTEAVSDCHKSYFVTLTIDDENLEILKNELEVKSVKGNENNIATLALRKFLERCRKKTGKSLKHWCVTELGEDRGRIHLHGIFFGNQAAELASSRNSNR